MDQEKGGGKGGKMTGGRRKMAADNANPVRTNYMAGESNWLKKEGPRECARASSNDPLFPRKVLLELWNEAVRLSFPV